MKKMTSRTLALLLAGNALFTVGCGNTDSNDKGKDNNQPAYVVTTTDGRRVELTEEQMKEIQKIIGTEKNTYKVIDKDGNEVELTDEQMAAINEMVEQNRPFTYDYNSNVVTVNGEEYIELTTEEFESLVTATIRDFEAQGLQVSREDVIKFVMVFNIDKLKQDNPELVKSIMGTQTIEEVFADAEKVNDTGRNREIEIMFDNNNPEWKAYVDGGLNGPYVANPELIPSVADVPFDEEQQELVRSIEARRDEILRESDVTRRSEMVNALLKDIFISDSEYRNLDDSTLYLVLSRVIVMLDGCYCRDFVHNTTNLDDSTYSLIVQFIAPVGSTEEQITNSIMSGARRNMMDSFKLCAEDAYTRAK